MLPSRPTTRLSSPPSRYHSRHLSGNKSSFSEKRKPSPLCKSYTSETICDDTVSQTTIKCEWVPVELHHASDAPATPMTPSPHQQQRKESARQYFKLFCLILAFVALGAAWTCGIKLQIEETLRNRNPTASSMLSPRSLEMVRGIKQPMWRVKYPEGEGKVLVVYSYTESRPAALQNAEHFIEKAVHDDADYVFVVNGNAPLLMPKLKNICNVRVVRRQADCLGFGAYGDALRSLSSPPETVVDESTEVELRKRSQTLDEYSKFIFVDDSVRGPYVIHQKGKKWTDAYTDSLDSQTKLQSVTYHCGRGETFIDPSIFATDRVGVEMFLFHGALSCKNTDKEAQEAKRLFTRLVRSEGYSANIATMGIRGVRQRAGMSVRYCLDRMADDPDPFIDVEYRPYETMWVKVRGADEISKRWSKK